MVDSTQAFIEAARDNESPTVDLLHNSLTVLQTQQQNSGNIRAFARDLALLTGTVAASDAKIRRILDQAGPAADELVLLVRTLRKVLPSFLKHMTSVSEVVDARLPALEQLLVTFPRLVSAGPSALLDSPSGEPKYGRVNLNLNNGPPAPCTNGYLPSTDWRPTTELEAASSPPLSSDHTFEPWFPAKCNSGPPINMRGTKYAPDPIDWESELTGDDD
jgi:phospholipid/cholesterol/gamma-HCH transport system substrate-binding protein